MSVEASAELKFLMAREGVPEETQQKLYTAGVRTVKQFASLVKDADGMRDLALRSFGLEGQDLETKVKVSCLICAFNAAKARATEMDRLDAENEVRSLPKVVPANDFFAMKSAFVTKHWALDKSRTPGKSYVEKKLEGLEKNEFRAEKLSEVVSYQEDDGGELRPVWDRSGALTSMKTQSSVPLPVDSEQLRLRISIMGAAWVFTSFQQTGNKILANLDPTIFDTYVNYLLGEHVWGLTAKGADGSTFGGPSWALLLSYEHEIRSHAYEEAIKGTPLASALRMAWKDETIKGRYFATPLALQHTKRLLDPAARLPPPKFQRQGSAAAHAAQDWARPDAGGAPRGKGRGKGKAKGKPRAGAPPNCASQTPEGKKICYDFNGSGCDRGDKCRFAHVCGVCFKKGKPMGSCDHKA